MLITRIYRQHPKDDSNNRCGVCIMDATQVLVHKILHRYWYNRSYTGISTIDLTHALISAIDLTQALI